jgi:hypothetical protein
VLPCDLGRDKASDHGLKGGDFSDKNRPHRFEAVWLRVLQGLGRSVFAGLTTIIRMRCILRMVQREHHGERCKSGAEHSGEDIEQSRRGETVSSCQRRQRGSHCRNDPDQDAPDIHDLLPMRKTFTKPSFNRRLKRKYGTRWLTMRYFCSFRVRFCASFFSFHFKRLEISTGNARRTAVFSAKRCAETRAGWSQICPESADYRAFVNRGGFGLGRPGNHRGCAPERAKTEGGGWCFDGVAETG